MYQDEREISSKVNDVDKGARFAGRFVGEVDPLVHFYRTVPSLVGEPVKKPQNTELSLGGYYELAGSAIVEAGDRYIDDDDKTCKAYTSIGMLGSNTSRRYFWPILSFN